MATNKPKPKLLQEGKDDEARGPRRIRRTLRQQARMLEQTLKSIVTAVERNGREAVDEALGEDAAELPKIYSELKRAAGVLGVENIPDLPA